MADCRLGDALMHIPTSEEEDVPEQPDARGLKSLNSGALVDFIRLPALARAAGAPPEAALYGVFEAYGYLYH